MENMSSRQAIEALEHAHALLDQNKDEEMRRTLQEIIHIFRTKEIFSLRLRQTSQPNLTYIPPGY